MKKAPFHLSLPCTSISKTMDFYIDVIGAGLGRNTTRWVDIDLFGNEITFTRSGEFKFDFKSYKFEETVLPSFHYGVIIDQQLWDKLYEKLDASEYTLTTKATFLQGKTGQHTSFFVRDPNGHTVEFKCFKNAKEIFS